VRAPRIAGVWGDVDHFLAMGFLQGLLAVLKGARHPGLLLILDEGGNTAAHAVRR